MSLIALNHNGFASVCWKVVRQISEDLRDCILQLDHFLSSFRKIQDHFGEEGITVSYKTIQRVLARKQKNLKGRTSKPKKSKNPGTPVVRTVSLIRKVVRAVKNPNPPTQRELSRKHRIGLSTVRRSLNED
jgi:transposase-like protein